MSTPARDLSYLNPAQQQAVRHGDGPLLVLAGAGTGKTSVITERFAHFIGERGIPPHRLLAVTFTNKAAREMRERTARVAGLDARLLDIGTFHRICGRLLRQHGEVLGLQPNFVIYDGDDQLQLIKLLLTELQIDPQRISPRSIRNRLEAWKNQGLLPQEVQAKDSDPTEGAALKVYRLYRERCITANAVDFSDMLLHGLSLLRQRPDIRQQLQRRWSHILVDEYQDTNGVQYAWIKALVTPAHSLTVVGDDDQSIYAWRGADIGNILRFERDFPGATVIRLEQNYRCTQTILDAANEVIAHNKARKGKTLFVRDRPGDKISLRIYDSERDEGTATAAAIGKAIDGGLSPSEVGVLYRTNAQSRPLEDALRRARVPYAIYGGVRFYDRREIKDALAYVRLLANPSSTTDFLRIVNVPARGIGKSSVERVIDAAAAAGIPLLEAADQCAESLRGPARLQLRSFCEMVQRWQQELAAGESLGRLVEHILNDSGYWPALRKDKSEEAADRLDNLKELVAAVDEYAALTESATLSGFLEDVALSTDIDSLQASGGGQVALMTLHAAKGLEFTMVVLPGMEEGLFPHARSLDDPASLEEERRLCYVGITRAKQTLLLSAARVRGNFGGVPQMCSLSRFLGEIPESLLDVDEALSTLSSDAPASLPVVRQENDAQAFEMGVAVHHGLFGTGEVQSAERSGSRQMLVIRFAEPWGRKTVLARFVERL
jgi:DNA helicase-2/ATP-dependent DNA helicase PcrA